MFMWSKAYIDRLEGSHDGGTTRWGVSDAPGKVVDVPDGRSRKMLGGSGEDDRGQTWSRWLRLAVEPILMGRYVGWYY